jgi:hypothetical protein
MTVEILDFTKSFLNPLLKLIIAIVFAIGTVMFYQAYTRYGGNLKKIAFYLMCGGITGFIACLFRVMGDFFSQWKWGESLLFLIFALISLVVANLVYTNFREIAIVFGMWEAEE